LSAESPVYYHISKDVATKSLEPPDLQSAVDIIDVQAKTISRESEIQGRLIISGYTFPYNLTSDDLIQPGLKRWNKNLKNMNKGRWMLDVEFSLPLQILCMVLAEDVISKMLVCLFLVPSDQPDGSYRRIGLCHWEGLVYQVRQYTGQEPVKQKVTVI
jgi:hypothetical protein